MATINGPRAALPRAAIVGRGCARGGIPAGLGRVPVVFALPALVPAFQCCLQTPPPVVEHLPIDSCPPFRLFAPQRLGKFADGRPQRARGQSILRFVEPPQQSVVRPPRCPVILRQGLSDGGAEVGVADSGFVGAYHWVILWQMTRRFS